jgi:nucleotide-binding universal stress UspA family protein
MKALKINKVLIALDLDQTAKKVAETGCSLAQSVGAEIVLLQIISDPVYQSLKEHVTITGFAGFKAKVPLKLDSIDELKIVAQHFLDSLKRHLGIAAIQTLVKEGDAAESILKTAKSLHADIIVIGSHSLKEPGNEDSGKVAEKVLDQTSIPLFIVPVKQKK